MHLMAFCVIVLLVTIPFPIVYSAQKENATNINSSAVIPVNAENISVSPRECDEIDIRNNCSNLLQLEGCTAIRGNLKIALIGKNNVTCSFENYTFPLLREITGYFIIYDLINLTSTRKLFPNLTVIRGQQLFQNYALGITRVPNVTALEFPSLVAIQRGHVFIGPSPKSCFRDLTDWDALTPTFGESHIDNAHPEVCEGFAGGTNITQNNTYTCPANCESKHCWSPQVCQHTIKDNLAKSQGTIKCDQQCLGGCYNTTSVGCVVCKNLNDHGNCVQDCPPDKYLLKAHQRCYTRDECIDDLKHFTYGKECITVCPNGYEKDLTVHMCIPCNNTYRCNNICGPEIPETPASIYSLSKAEEYRGCHTINSSLIISLQNKVDEEILNECLSSLQVVRGHLKVYRNTYLTSLKFLKNLRSIEADPLETHTFGLIIYGNPKLKQLWNPVKDFEIVRGGLYMQKNDQLCNHLLKTFVKAAKHNSTNDFLQQSDQEALCEPTTISLNVQVESTDSFTLIWRRDQTAGQVKLMWRRMPPGSTFVEESVLDTDVCKRINWEQRLLFRHEMEAGHDGTAFNTTHFMYKVNGLLANTQYACVMKTFGEQNELNATVSREGRSKVIRVITMPEIPRMPRIAVTKKTDTSIKVSFWKPMEEVAVIDHYNLKLFEQPDNVTLLDFRNYCTQPMIYHDDSDSDMGTYVQSYLHEDYDACCARREEDKEDEEFKLGIEKDFSCSLKNTKNCMEKRSSVSKTNSQPIRIVRLDVKATDIWLHNLAPFRQYIIQLAACTKDSDCGSHAILSVRTNYSVTADRLSDLNACHEPEIGEYRVFFKEPPAPNGAIVAYMIHFSGLSPTMSSSSSSEKLAKAVKRNHVISTRCVTRLQHQQANSILKARFNSSVIYTQVMVRVFSLGLPRFSNKINVTLCHGAGIGPPPLLAGFAVASGRHTHGLNVFFVCFLLGACGTLLWLCYKRRCWRQLPQLRRFLPFSWRSMIFAPRRHFGVMGASAEDRQILVDSFETVRFHNDSDDEHKYLE